jgi:hypothetical protein
MTQEDHNQFIAYKCAKICCSFLLKNVEVTFVLREGANVISVQEYTKLPNHICENKKMILKICNIIYGSNIQILYS